MKHTLIRWADWCWNPFTGCDSVSEGCDVGPGCYAREIATRYAGTPAFPNGFDPTFHPDRLDQPARCKTPSRIFVNSMSDVHHEDFSRDQIDAVYDVMLAVPRHDYLVCTHRPQRMRRYFTDPDDGYLARRGLEQVPQHIWLGVTIELGKYAFRANHLRAIPAVIRWVSVEPMLGPVGSLDLTGLAWVVVGGQSGNGFTPWDLAWPREIRDRCADAGVAYFFKQSPDRFTERGITLDNQLHEEFPLPHPDPVRRQ